MSLRVCITDSACLQLYVCVFLNPPPISHKKPKLSNNMPQLCATIAPTFLQWHVRRN